MEGDTERCFLPVVMDVVECQEVCLNPWPYSVPALNGLNKLVQTRMRPKPRHMNDCLLNGQTERQSEETQSVKALLSNWYCFLYTLSLYNVSCLCVSVCLGVCVSVCVGGCVSEHTLLVLINNMLVFVFSLCVPYSNMHVLALSCLWLCCWLLSAGPSPLLSSPWSLCCGSRVIRFGGGFRAVFCTYQWQQAGIGQQGGEGWREGGQGGQRAAGSWPC